MEVHLQVSIRLHGLHMDNFTFIGTLLPEIKFARKLIRYQIHSKFLTKLGRVHAKLHTQTQAYQIRFNFANIMQRKYKTHSMDDRAQYACNNFVAVIYGHRPGCSFALFLMACICATSLALVVNKSNLNNVAVYLNAHI
jgi:hypothetical protein